jgi:hypothetical protein
MVSIDSANLVGSTFGASVADNLSDGPSSAALNVALGEELRTRLSSMLVFAGQPVVSALLGSKGPIDWYADRDVTLRSFLANALAADVQTDPSLQATVDQSVNSLPADVTVGSMLNLDLPLDKHPLFAGAIAQLQLVDMLGTSPSIDGATAQAFTNAYSENSLPLHQFWAQLPNQPGFSAASAAAIQKTLQLGLLTMNNVPLIAAIQKRGDIAAVSDLLKLSVGDWTQLIQAPPSGQPVSIPSAIPGADQQQRTDTYVAGMMSLLREAFPTTWVGINVGQMPAIDLQLVKAFMQANPGVDLARSLPVTLDWAAVPDAQRQATLDALAGLRQELKAFPGFDWRAAAAIGDSAIKNDARVDLAHFFASHPDFDFSGTVIDDYMAANDGAALAAIGDPSRTTLNLKRLQRVFQVAPRYEHMVALLGEGYDSAYKISLTPEPFFVDHMKAALGEAPAQACYARACNVNAVMKNVLANYAEPLNSVTTHVTTRLADVKTAIPNYDALFGAGALDLCDCEECRSVYSPAAYLVDLLYFLRVPQNKYGNAPMDVLLNRRPDIGNLKLNCDNTNLAIPYVDLVNEILETYLASGAPEASDSTGYDQQDLLTTPENTNWSAYQRLEGAVYPFNLPFDLPLEVVRAYLAQMGTSRLEVLQTFVRPASTPMGSTTAAPISVGQSGITAISVVSTKGWLPQPGHEIVLGSASAVRQVVVVAGGSTKVSIAVAPFTAAADFPVGTDIASNVTQSADIAMESIAVSPEERAVINGSHGMPTHFPYEFYGFSRDLVDYVDNRTGKTVHGSWTLCMAQVPDFLQRTGCTFVDLEQLLATRFLNPDSLGGSQMTLDTTGNACNVDTMQITNLSSSRLDLIHRFIRLSRKLGWTTPDLDAALFALGAVDVTDAVLVNIAAVVSVQQRLKLTVQEAASFWGPINTHGPGSLFLQLFQNKAVLNPPDPAFALSGDDLASSTGKISEHMPAILAALRISGVDLDYLLLTPGMGFSSIGNTVTLPNLSALKRCALLARALRAAGGPIRTVRDINSVKLLTGIDPFVPASPQSTVDFLSAADDIARSPMKLGELGYVYHHVPDEITALDLSPDHVTSAVLTLAKTLRIIAAENQMPPTPSVDLLARKLPEVMDATLTDQAIGITLGTSHLTVADQGAFIDLHFAQFLDATQAKTQLVTATTPSLQQQQLNLQFVLSNLLAFLLQTESRKAVTGTIESAFGLAPDIAELLLTIVRRSGMWWDSMNDFLLLRYGGLGAEYYPAPNLTGAPHARLDPVVDFNWQGAAPAPGIPPDKFSARWSGKLLPRLTGRHALAVDIVGGAVLWIGGTKVIDRWNGPSSKYTATVDLVAGRLVDVKLEYQADIVPGSPHARLSLSWANQSMAPTVIPTTQLYIQVVLDLAGASYTYLGRIGLLAIRFGLTATEISYLAGKGVDFGGFDFNGLPDTAATYKPAVFAAWRRVAGYFGLRQSLSGRTATLVDVFSAAATGSLPGAIAALEKASGWDAQRVDSLVAGDAFNLTASKLRNEIELLRMQRAISLLDRLGASAAPLFNLAKPELTAADADKMREAAKAGYDQSQWAAAARLTNDRLRAMRQRALVGYVMGQEGFVDPAQLFDKFLVDVQMGTCMVTSRIQQAIASVQLFVQRCLLNLERDPGQPDDVPPWSIETVRWSWMKHYQTWAANRMVFLYPENWLVPELRDDKTEFFKQMESDLRQGDVTPDTAEQAVHTYLEKLDQVARLDIRAIYLDNYYVHHVFGRTFASPFAYYHSQAQWSYDLQANQWTPWEKVDLDIQGDHIIPVVWNSRLHLIWSIWTEKADTPDPSKPASLPASHWEVQLAWSEKRHDQWTPKRVSTSREVPFGLTPELVNFKTRIDSNGDLIVILQFIYISTGIFAFRFNGCGGSVTVESTGLTWFTFLLEPAWVSPGATTADQLTGAEDQMFNGRLPLTLLRGVSQDDPDVFQLIAEAVGVPTLGLAPSPWRIAYPSQFHQFQEQAPFFYEDMQRTYFVTEKWSESAQSLAHPEDIQPVSRLGWTALDSSALAKAGPPVGSQSGWRFNGGKGLSGGLMVNGSSISNLGAGAVPVAVAGIPAETVAVYGAEPAASPAQATDTTGSARALWNRWVIDSGTQSVNLQFFEHFHHYVCDFVARLNNGGVDYLLMLDSQLLAETAAQIGGGGQTNFNKIYKPTSNVSVQEPLDNVDFSFGSPYSTYNWELFFHAPLLIAGRLTQEQQFAEAQRWLHYIFDPTTSDGIPAPQRYWKFLPFYLNTDPQNIQDLLDLIDDNDPAMLRQLADWQKHPFDPFRIARIRLAAFEKNVVMRYLDNLIAWGDYLFNQNTRETIEEATLLYMLAHQILGPRPPDIPQSVSIQDQTFFELWPYLDEFANVNVNLENAIPYSGQLNSGPDNGRANTGGDLEPTFYFCIPRNSTLMGYWDTVDDRLNKIRNCMNIKGVVESLPLFEPLVDPGRLIAGRTVGTDGAGALADVNVPAPYYRFTYVIQKAFELCAEVRSLGASLLSALEKRDAEALATLRAGQETDLLRLSRQIKQHQLEEANATLAGLQKTFDLANARYTFYSLIEQRSAFETQQLFELAQAQTAQETSQLIDILGSEMALIPNFDLGASGIASPVVTATFGGSNIAQALGAYSRVFSFIASLHTYNANLASIKGGWARRSQDWALQAELARIEMDQINRQQIAAQARIDATQADLDSHDKQIANAATVENFLRTKYTSQDLYDWMIGQVSGVYFQCYQLTYTLAQRAEKAFRFERGVTDSSFVRFGYWDNLNKGLLAGERLYYDLKRLEMAYLDQNQREYEIVKNISLAQLDGLALIQLRETGSCEIDVPESLFDVDYPGHYMRRLKSVALSIPCVVGPNTSLNCTLTLLKNQIRMDSDPANYTDPSHFLVRLSATQSIATSHGQNDSGMFELNFRDERYLPFELNGAVSRWRIELPKDTNAIDFETISDLIVRMSYTARDGGNLLKAAAKLAVKYDGATGSPTNGTDPSIPYELELMRLCSSRHEYSNEWFQFLHPDDASTAYQLQLSLSPERFPYRFRGNNISVTSVDAYVRVGDAFVNAGKISPAAGLKITIGAPDKSAAPETLVSSRDVLAWTPWASVDYNVSPQTPQVPGTWTITIQEADLLNQAPQLQELVTINGVPHHRFKPGAIEDLFLVCHYGVT